jgi:hypothetical protein
MKKLHDTDERLTAESVDKVEVPINAIMQDSAMSQTQL